MTGPDRSSIVVVGVDGSAHGERALHWAEKYAHAHGSTLRLVCAWELPLSLGRPIPHEGYEPVAAAREIVEKAASGLSIGPERIEQMVPVGHAGEVLVDASRDAELLVVGHRGHGAIADRLVGSVSGYCLHHAHVPVVVVN